VPTKVTIISFAISLVGHKPIVSLDNPDDLVLAAEQAFNMLLPSVLAKSNWRFATQIAQLSLLNETPPNPWQSVYSLPAGFLKTIRVYPQTYGWEIYESKRIYAMQQGEFWMEYVFVPDISLMPGYFVEYLAYEIAAFLALSNAQRPDFYSVLAQRLVTQQAMASAIDAQNRPQGTMAVFPVLAARESLSTFIGNSA
jgi:hypothetical protein